MWFVIEWSPGPRFEHQSKSVSEAKEWTERYEGYQPLKQGWSMSWTYSRRFRSWVLTVVDSKGRRMRPVAVLRRMRPDELKRFRIMWPSNGPYRTEGYDFASIAEAKEYVEAKTGLPEGGSRTWSLEPKVSPDFVGDRRPTQHWVLTVRNSKGQKVKGVVLWEVDIDA